MLGHGLQVPEGARAVRSIIVGKKSYQSITSPVLSSGLIVVSGAQIAQEDTRELEGLFPQLEEGLEAEGFPENDFPAESLHCENEVAALDGTGGGHEVREVDGRDLEEIQDPVVAWEPKSLRPRSPLGFSLVVHRQNNIFAHRQNNLVAHRQNQGLISMTPRSN